MRNEFEEALAKQKTLPPRPDFCNACPIGHLTEGYVPVQKGTGRELWVGEAADEEDAKRGKPFAGGAGAWLNSMLRGAGIARSTLNIVNTIGCRPPQNVFPGSEKWTWTDGATARQGVEYCRQHHLEPALVQIEPSRVVALGDEALQATTGRKGILLWRGSPLPLRGKPQAGPKVMPTLHPTFLMRQASMFSVAVKDLKKSLELPPEHYELYPTLEALKAFHEPIVSFDFEWDEWSNITLCGIGGRPYKVLVVDFKEPYIAEIRRILEEAEVLIGHNLIDAEMAFVDKWGWNIKAKLHDTMLAQHLIQPDMKHALHFVASVFTTKVFWKGQGEEEEDQTGNIIPTGAQWKTWDSPDAIPREFGGYGGCFNSTEAFRLYNARDVDATLLAEPEIFRVLKNFGQESVYWNVSVPGAYICRDINATGLRIDPTRVKAIREDLEAQIGTTEQTLPEGLKPYEIEITKQIPAPEGTYKPKTLKCKGAKKSGTAHEPTTWVVETAGETLCPRCNKVFSPRLIQLKRIKVPGTKRIVPWNSTDKVMAYAKELGCREVLHQKSGNATGDKRARKIWGREYAEFTIVDVLKKLNTQRNSFAKEALMGLARVHFRLAITGTSEGRLACRGVYPANLNLQNQPKAIKKIFIPDQDGYGILSHDIVQGENMLTTWLAKDWARWERLNTPGYDEHCEIAALFFQRPVPKTIIDEKTGKEVENPLRKVGKVINHGRNYGLGERKSQDYLAAEGFNLSLGDVRAIIDIWKTLNKRTAEWQNETIYIAQRQSYLENPFGRRRWFQGRDFATKALAFLPASTLADMVLRMMIASYPSRFGKEILALGLPVVAEMVPGWRMMLQVHDDLVFTGPHETYLEQAHRTRAIMECQWRELDGFSFRVDTKYSTLSWGDTKSLAL